MPYKDELKGALYELIDRFFKEEKNNRITSFNINGLIGNLNVLLENHKMKNEDKNKNK